MAENENRYGRLRVIEASLSKPRPSFLCECDCGARVVVVRYSLRSGKTQSCGCLQRERTSEAARICNLKHGHAVNGKMTAEYIAWRNMLSRCSNPKDVSYKHYGARGISVCEAWASSFASFLADMGHRPAAWFSIDRINNGGNYEPSNCRWATRIQQERNKRTNRVISINGTAKTASEWAAIAGISKEALYVRLKLGWEPEKAISTPLRRVHDRI